MKNRTDVFFYSFYWHQVLSKVHCCHAPRRRREGWWWSPHEAATLGRSHNGGTCRGREYWVGIGNSHSQPRFTPQQRTYTRPPTVVVACTTPAGFPRLSAGPGASSLGRAQAHMLIANWPGPITRPNHVYGLRALASSSFPLQYRYLFPRKIFARMRHVCLCCNWPRDQRNICRGLCLCFTIRRWGCRAIRPRTMLIVLGWVVLAFFLRQCCCVSISTTRLKIPRPLNCQ